MFNLIARNAVNFLALMFLLMLMPPAVYAVKGWLSPQTPAKFDGTAQMPALKDYDWARQSMWETYLSRLNYRDFIVQRSDDFAGEVLNVENGIRRTIGVPREGAGTPVWFFGGSTTWGYGLHDAFTYPSMFAQASGRAVTNYGEGAYTSRQSLAYLQNVYLEGHAGNRTVVFYDGINDVMHGCYIQAGSINETAHETRYRAALRHLDNPHSFDRLFEPLVEFARHVPQRLGLVKTEIAKHVCGEDQERARKVAENLVTIWENAQLLAEANGDTFLAILQPVSFMSRNDDPVLPNHPYYASLRANFEATYPLILEALANSEVNYIDLSDIYDDCPACYYDHAHVGPEAHQRLVERLIEFVP